jgi:hypothetical protein
MASRSPASEQLLFVGDVVGERADQALCRIQMPRGEGPAGLGNAVRRDVADQAREILFNLPAQMTGEQQYFGGEPRIAAHFDRAQRVLLAAPERREQLGLQGHRKRRIAAARLHRAPLPNAQA